jgi:hypothetical protein
MLSAADQANGDADDCHLDRMWATLDPVQGLIERSDQAPLNNRRRGRRSLNRLRTERRH